MRYNDDVNKHMFVVRAIFLDPRDKGVVLALLELDNAGAKVVSALVERIKFTNGTQKAFVDVTADHYWVVEELLLRRT